MINLFNPTIQGFYDALLVAFLLGIVHGITPDEHTWPITFSYAVGTTNTKGGAKAGLIFSTGFTLQRALMSEIAFFALAPVFFLPYYDGIIYIIVGSVMALSGFYIMKRLKYPHFHFFERILGNKLKIHKPHSHGQELEYEHKVNPLESEEHDDYRPVPLKLAFVHGLIAGFGFGAFALILFTIISPSMPNAYVAWLPGALFGLGTMAMQVLFGTVFAAWIIRVKKLTKEGLSFVARGISSYVLAYGGLAFVFAGISTILYPKLFDYAIVTPIYVHNLHNLGIGFFLVIISVVVIGYIGYKVNLRKAIKKGLITT